MDQLFVPSIEDAMNLNVQDLPAELSRMVASIKNVFFSLLQIPQQFFIEGVLFAQFVDLLCVLSDWRASYVNLLFELANGLVADVLANNKLVFSNLFV